MLDSISHPFCSVGSEVLSQLYRDKNIKLTKPPILKTLPDIPTPTSTFYTKDFYIKKIDILNDISELVGKKVKFKYSDTVLLDVPDSNFKGPF